MSFGFWGFEDNLLFLWLRLVSCCLGFEISLLFFEGVLIRVYCILEGFRIESIVSWRGFEVSLLFFWGVLYNDEKTRSTQ